jgi:hypothetical protein
MQRSATLQDTTWLRSGQELCMLQFHVAVGEIGLVTVLSFIRDDMKEHVSGIGQLQ